MKTGDRLPPVLPVTVYNGQPRWRAATGISELISPVPAPLSRYLPKSRLSAAERHLPDVVPVERPIRNPVGIIRPDLPVDQGDQSRPDEVEAP